MPDEIPLLSDDLVTRFALDEGGFRSLAIESARRRGHGQYSRETLRHALSYPFASLPFSFLMVGRNPWPFLSSFDGSGLLNSTVLFEGQEKKLSELSLPPLIGERYPLLSYGANASIDSLSRKLSKLKGEDQVAPVVAGWLEGFDVGPSAHFSSYGAMPGTIYANADVDAKVAIVWVTSSQLNAIAESEFNYLFGSLPSAGFTPLGGNQTHKDLLTFVSRHGVLEDPDGDPIAFAAVDAVGRRKASLHQEEVLTYAAGLTGNQDAGSLVRRIATDYEWAVEAGYEVISRFADRGFLRNGSFQQVG